jgi:hypothetical protein
VRAMRPGLRATTAAHARCWLSGRARAWRRARRRLEAALHWRRGRGRRTGEQPAGGAGRLHRGAERGSRDQLAAVQDHRAARQRERAALRAQRGPRRLLPGRVLCLALRLRAASEAASASAWGKPFSLGRYKWGQACSLSLQCGGDCGRIAGKLQLRMRRSVQRVWSMAAGGQFYKWQTRRAPRTKPKL